MCLGGAPSAPAPVIQPTTQPVQQVVAPPPPPPQTVRQPASPVIAAPSANAKGKESASRTGTSIFRNDLSIPVTGNGINIPV